MKLCAECHHAVYSMGPGLECLHPKNVVVEPVHGSAHLLLSARLLRGLGRPCGPDAEWFEQRVKKPGLLARLWGKPA